jgi:rhodanese-related sulfurtransferase
LARKLHNKGILKVRPLAGGFYGWRDAGLPITEEETAASA